MSIVRRSASRLGALLVLITLVLANLGSSYAAQPTWVEEGIDPSTPMSSDGLGLEQTTTGIVYDSAGAFTPSADGTGVESKTDTVTMVDESVSNITAPAPSSVIGPDNRVQITATTSDPYRRIAHVTFSSGGSNYQCTAWMISANTAATAGHCVYGSSGWSTNVRVYPGRSGSSTPYGSCTAVRLYAPSGWTSSQSASYDYAAIKLNCTVGNQTGWFGLRVQSNTGFVGQQAKISGYPGDKPSGTQWYHAGTVRSVSSTRVTYDTDTFGGQSGSPVYNSSGSCTNCAVAVHTNGGSYNSGTRINNTVLTNLNNWKNAAP